MGVLDSLKSLIGKASSYKVPTIFDIGKKGADVFKETFLEPAYNLGKENIKLQEEATEKGMEVPLSYKIAGALPFGPSQVARNLLKSQIAASDSGTDFGAKERAIAGVGGVSQGLMQWLQAATPVYTLGGGLIGKGTEAATGTDYMKVLGEKASEGSQAIVSPLVDLIPGIKDTEKASLKESLGELTRFAANMIMERVGSNVGGKMSGAGKLSAKEAATVSKLGFDPVEVGGLIKDVVAKTPKQTFFEAVGGATGQAAADSLLASFAPGSDNSTKQAQAASVPMNLLMAGMGKVASKKSGVSKEVHPEIAYAKEHSAQKASRPFSESLANLELTKEKAGTNYVSPTRDNPNFKKFWENSAPKMKVPGAVTVASSEIPVQAEVPVKPEAAVSADIPVKASVPVQEAAQQTKAHRSKIASALSKVSKKTATPVKIEEVSIPEATPMREVPSVETTPGVGEEVKLAASEGTVNEGTATPSDIRTKQVELNNLRKQEISDIVKPEERVTQSKEQPVPEPFETEKAPTGPDIPSSREVHESQVGKHGASAIPFTTGGSGLLGRLFSIGENLSHVVLGNGKTLSEAVRGHLVDRTPLARKGMIESGVYEPALAAVKEVSNNRPATREILAKFKSYFTSDSGLKNKIIGGYDGGDVDFQRVVETGEMPDSSIGLNGEQTANIIESDFRAGNDKRFDIMGEENKNGLRDAIAISSYIDKAMKSGDEGAIALANQAREIFPEIAKLDSEEFGKLEDNVYEQEGKAMVERGELPGYTDVGNGFKHRVVPREAYLEAIKYMDKKNLTEIPTYEEFLRKQTDPTELAQRQVDMVQSIVKNSKNVRPLHFDSPLLRVIDYLDRNAALRTNRAAYNEIQAAAKSSPEVAKKVGNPDVAMRSILNLGGENSYLQSGENIAGNKSLIAKTVNGFLSNVVAPAALFMNLRSLEQAGETALAYKLAALANKIVKAPFSLENTKAAGRELSNLYSGKFASLLRDNSVIEKPIDIRRKADTAKSVAFMSGGEPFDALIKIERAAQVAREKLGLPASYTQGQVADALSSYLKKADSSARADILGAMSESAAKISDHTALARTNVEMLNTPIFSLLKTWVRGTAGQVVNGLQKGAYNAYKAISTENPQISQNAWRNAKESVLDPFMKTAGGALVLAGAIYAWNASKPDSDPTKIKGENAANIALEAGFNKYGLVNPFEWKEFLKREAMQTIGSVSPLSNLSSLTRQSVRASDALGELAKAVNGQQADYSKVIKFFLEGPVLRASTQENVNPRGQFTYSKDIPVKIGAGPDIKGAASSIASRQYQAETRIQDPKQFIQDVLTAIVGRDVANIGSLAQGGYREGATKEADKAYTDFATKVNTFMDGKNGRSFADFLKVTMPAEIKYDPQGGARSILGVSGSAYKEREALTKILRDAGFESEAGKVPVLSGDFLGYLNEAYTTNKPLFDKIMYAVSMPVNDAAKGKLDSKFTENQDAQLAEAIGSTIPDIGYGISDASTKVGDLFSQAIGELKLKSDRGGKTPQEALSAVERLVSSYRAVPELWGELNRSIGAALSSRMNSKEASSILAEFEENPENYPAVADAIRNRQKDMSSPVKGKLESVVGKQTGVTEDNKYTPSVKSGTPIKKLLTNAALWKSAPLGYVPNLSTKKSKKSSQVLLPVPKPSKVKSFSPVEKNQKKSKVAESLYKVASQKRK